MRWPKWDQRKEEKKQNVSWQGWVSEARNQAESWRTWGPCLLKAHEITGVNLCSLNSQRSEEGPPWKFGYDAFKGCKIYQKVQFHFYSLQKHHVGQNNLMPVFFNTILTFDLRTRSILMCVHIHITASSWLAQHLESSNISLALIKGVNHAALTLCFCAD